MNRFLVASGIVGSTLGFFHGRQIRPQPQFIHHEIMYSVRDVVIGAVVYPFMIPISLYQIAANSPANTCVFKSMSSLFSQPSSETLE